MNGAARVLIGLSCIFARAQLEVCIGCDHAINFHPFAPTYNSATAQWRLILAAQ